MGGDDVEQAVRVGHACTRLSLWAGSALAVGLALTSPFLPHVFTNDPAVISRLTAGLLVLAVMQLPGAVAFALDGALIGAQDERFLGRAAIGNLAAFAPLAIATLLDPALGIVGIMGAQLMWMTCRALVNSRRFDSRRWALVPAVR
jgi:Na+-driven multidrug efflux pump